MALNALLCNHPDLVMCDVREPHFFDTETQFQGTPDFDVYHAQFPDNSAARMTGEATPDYLYWPPALQRICDHNPAMGFIILLRHPVDRACSQRTMASKRGREPKPFGQAVADKIA